MAEFQSPISGFAFNPESSRVKPSKYTHHCDLHATEFLLQSLLCKTWSFLLPHASWLHSDSPRLQQTAGSSLQRADKGGELRLEQMLCAPPFWKHTLGHECTLIWIAVTSVNITTLRCSEEFKSCQCQSLCGVSEAVVSTRAARTDPAIRQSHGRGRPGRRGRLAKALLITRR